MIELLQRIQLFNSSKIFRVIVAIVLTIVVGFAQFYFLIFLLLFLCRGEFTGCESIFASVVYFCLLIFFGICDLTNFIVIIQNDYRTSEKLFVNIAMIVGAIIPVFICIVFILLGWIGVHLFF